MAGRGRRYLDPVSAQRTPCTVHAAAARTTSPKAIRRITTIRCMTARLRRRRPRINRPRSGYRVIPGMEMGPGAAQRRARLAPLTVFQAAGPVYKKISIMSCRQLQATVRPARAGPPNRPACRRPRSRRRARPVRRRGRPRAGSPRRASGQACAQDRGSEARSSPSPRGSASPRQAYPRRRCRGSRPPDGPSRTVRRRPPRSGRSFTRTTRR